MSRFYNLARRLLPTSMQLAWSRVRIERGYHRDIAAAKSEKDHGKVESLEAEMRFELDLQREEEDAYRTRRLLRSATYLCVPVPSLYDESGGLTGQWYEGSQTGGRYLTFNGIRALREEIRRERKDRYALFISLLAGITGVVGALAGLVAAFRS